MQSRRTSILEAGANVVLGLGLSFLLQLVMFQVLGIIATVGQNILITTAFSGLSMARGYILRRLFNRYGAVSECPSTPLEGRGP